MIRLIAAVLLVTALCGCDAGRSFHQWGKEALDKNEKTG